MGSSQYFFRTFKNPHRSRAKSIKTPYLFLFAPWRLGVRNRESGQSAKG
jgi:hypothetical protein